MLAREKAATPGVWGDRLTDVFPFLQPGFSDSGSLDNVFELLMQSGRSLPHVKEMLMPAAWENVPDLEPELAAFYAYHAFLTEPWDGPAAIAATDGSRCWLGWIETVFVPHVGWSPPRWCSSRRRRVFARRRRPKRPPPASSAWRADLLRWGNRRGAARRPRSRSSGHARPYGDWVNTETLRIQASFDSLADDRFDAAALSRVFGYTAEERRLVIADMAQGGNPLGSMGDDTGLAVLAKRPRRLTHFFHELFAQVTNPPMDPIREKLVMSLRIQLGSAARCSRTPRSRPTSSSWPARSSPMPSWRQSSAPGIGVSSPIGSQPPGRWVTAPRG